MDLTILICTRNSAGRLPETLEHIKQQKYVENISCEVLIVDYLSSDDTPKVAKQLWTNHIVPLRVISESKPGKTPALETGFKAAQGTAVCIVDDDNWIHEEYVSVAHTIMKNHPDVGVIGAYGEAQCEIEPPAWFEKNKSNYAVGSQGKESGYVEDMRRLWFWGAGSVIRKDAWLKAKRRGFVPILNPTRGDGSTQFNKGFTGGEDPELCYAIQLAGYRLWYEPSLIYKHFIPKARLTEKFINDTSSGVQTAAPIIRLYLAELTPYSFLGIFRKVVYKNWFLHLFYLLLSFVRSIIKSCGSDYKNTLLTISIVKVSHHAQIKAMWDLRSSFDEVVQSIQNLRTNKGEVSFSSETKCKHSAVEKKK